jgi:SAM-dependent methyltransferase
MSRWDKTVTRTTEDAKQFWAAAPLETLYDMMQPDWVWHEWLRVAAGVVTEPGLVFEPGCGIGVLADLLPEGCDYYGCDINPGYIEEARRLRPRPGVRFEVRDLDDVLSQGDSFDWVVVTSLFGMFPEEAAYEWIPRFWAIARRGLSVTTMSKQDIPRRHLMRFDFTAHEPDRLLAAGRTLRSAGRVELHSGQEFPVFQGHHWRRGLALYAWRDREG